MILSLENLGINIALKIAKILAKTKITPRQVTIARFIISAPLSLYFFSQGKYIYNVIGLFLYIFLAIFDWVDGRLAELKKLPSETKPLGRLIDSTLDQILMMIVLGSIFYAGINSDQREIWLFITIFYFSSLLFLNTLLYKFEQIIGLEYKKYPEVGEKISKFTKNFFLRDRILWSFIYVRSNSIATFFFTVSYPLFLGIIFNQLIPIFIFISFMTFLRGIVIFFVLYQILNVKRSNLATVNVLRKYVRSDL